MLEWKHSVNKRISVGQLLLTATTSYQTRDFDWPCLSANRWLVRFFWSSFRTLNNINKYGERTVLAMTKCEIKTNIEVDQIVQLILSSPYRRLFITFFVSMCSFEVRMLQKGICYSNRRVKGKTWKGKTFKAVFPTSNLMFVGVFAHRRHTNRHNRQWQHFPINKRTKLRK